MPAETMDTSYDAAMFRLKKLVYKNRIRSVDLYSQWLHRSCSLPLTAHFCAAELTPHRAAAAAVHRLRDFLQDFDRLRKGEMLPSQFT